MIQAKKNYGQHFLHDKNILEKMSLMITKNAKRVLEIGPGTGALTQFLVDQKVALTAIEIDSRCYDLLESRFPSLNLVKADILDTNISSYVSQIDVLAGNLPYYISTQILIKHRDECPLLPGFYLVQKEVADRLSANIGSKDYGRLTIAIRLNFDVKVLFNVPPTAFSPMPKVDSSFIMLTPHQHNYSAPKLFDDVVKEAFSHRRKKLRNALANLSINWENVNKELFDLRPEDLSINDFIHLAAHLKHPQI